MRSYGATCIGCGATTGVVWDDPETALLYLAHESAACPRPGVEFRASEDLSTGRRIADFVDANWRGGEPDARERMAGRLYQLVLDCGGEP